MKSRYRRLKAVIGGGGTSHNSSTNRNTFFLTLANFLKSFVPITRSFSLMYQGNKIVTKSTMNLQSANLFAFACHSSLTLD